MAYQFADGFDNYGNAYTLTAGYPWDFIQGGNSTTTADPRFAAPAGIPGASISVSTGSTGWIRKNLLGTPATLFVGFGFKISGLPASGLGDIFTLWDSGTAQVSLTINSNGAVQFARSVFPGTLIGTQTANGVIQANVWYGAAIAVTINASTGSVALYLNGNSTPLINSSSLNTQATGNAQATQVSLGAVANGKFTTIKYDDFYCFDSSGGFLNSLPSGDRRIFTKLPNGAGNYTNWTPNGLASNWQNAAVAPPNTSDFNSNNTNSTKDSYALPPISLTATPTFVMARASLTRDDASVHTPSLMVRSSSTDGVGSALSPITSGYLFYDTVFQNDPNTSTLWTGAGADAAQVGVVTG